MIGSSGICSCRGTPEPLFREIASEPSSASMGAECGAAYVELKIHGNSAEARTYANSFTAVQPWRIILKWSRRRPLEDNM